jgi:segregation and condensation protein B
VVGQPILYKTTKDFLVQFGLKDLSELPTLKEFEELGRMEIVDEEAEPPALEVAAEAPETVEAPPTSEEPAGPESEPAENA